MKHFCIPIQNEVFAPGRAISQNCGAFCMKLSDDCACINNKKHFVLPNKKKILKPFFHDTLFCLSLVARPWWPNPYISVFNGPSMGMERVWAKWMDHRQSI